MAEHGVELVQLIGPRLERGHIRAGRLRHVGHVGVGVRQELVQRRIQQANGDRQTGHDGEQLDEVLALIRQQLVESGAAVLLVGGEDHLAHMDDPLRIEEHVLGAAQPDTLATEVARRARVQRGFRVGAHLHRADTRRPSPSACRNHR